jgi:hypothetical protein
MEKTNPNVTYKRPKELNGIPDSMVLKFGNHEYKLKVVVSVDGLVQLRDPDSDTAVLEYDDIESFTNAFC